MSIVENFTEIGAPSKCIDVDTFLDENEVADEYPYIFADSLLKHAPWQIARFLTRECGDDFTRIVANIRTIKMLSHESFHNDVAKFAFGEKLSGDLGIRSTQSHPKTDYGEPRFGSGWDMDVK